MTFATRLAELDVAVVQVTHLANGCVTGLAHQAYLSGWQPNLSIIAFFCLNLSRAARSPHQLPALTFV
jgi:hypothetical protein